MHNFAKKIMECVKANVESVGINNVCKEDLCEIGQWVDIAKDFTEYEKNYKIIEAMEEETDQSYRMGYHPFLREEEDWIDRYLRKERTPEHNEDYSRRPERTGRWEPSRYGESYDRYNESRKHYRESHDMKHKEEMEDSIREYVDGVIRTMREVWGDSEPSEKERIKADLTKMVQQLT